MRKIILKAIILGLGACFLAAGNPAQDVARAVKDLKSPDLLVVRAAIRKLGDLSKVPNVHSAVKPLTQILSQEGRPFDSYTRSLAGISGSEPDYSLFLSLLMTNRNVCPQPQQYSSSQPAGAPERFGGGA